MFPALSIDGNQFSGIHPFYRNPNPTGTITHKATGFFPVGGIQVPQHHAAAIGPAFRLGCPPPLENLVRVHMLVDQPPAGPDSGPAAQGCIVPVLHLELARAA